MTKTVPYGYKECWRIEKGKDLKINSLKALLKFFIHYPIRNEGGSIFDRHNTWFGIDLNLLASGDDEALKQWREQYYD